ncbi:hypothetical protein GT347_10355 [Xylophilus rhododendri]|uniref:Uncharacterized protein n=1 Tax=Xylophilus rhododendri TaxID=2697032 RepID=A0A857J5J5_9BURK|nr:hypothetical protein [Xylophilus rhododendri]QHI98359.1 hypothetical protein GT347_10355 [Xylophilus rhododendri]
MNAIVIEHVLVAELPQAWRDRLRSVADDRVTVRIEAEPTSDIQSGPELADDPLFGMWRDREDMGDVAAYIRSSRAPRFTGGTGEDWYRGAATSPNGPG